MYDSSGQKKFSLLDNEDLLLTEGFAHLKEGILGTDGTLYLTNRRLVFCKRGFGAWLVYGPAALAVNAKKIQVDVPLDSISRLSIGKHFATSTLIIQTHDGGTYEVSTDMAQVFQKQTRELVSGRPPEMRPLSNEGCSTRKDSRTTTKETAEVPHSGDPKLFRIMTLMCIGLMVSLKNLDQDYAWIILFLVIGAAVWSTVHIHSSRQGILRSLSKQNGEKLEIHPSPLMDQGRSALDDPEIEIIEEEDHSKVRLQCQSCGYDKTVDRSKFGDRLGTVRVRCPKCRGVILVTLET